MDQNEIEKAMATTKQKRLKASDSTLGTSGRFNDSSFRKTATLTLSLKKWDIV
jgi:hypothetical protein